jgi:lipid-A-disaccharide synthase
MSLTVALAGIPGAVVYRAHPLTWFLGRRLISGRVSHLGMANLLLQREAWPELLQVECSSTRLSRRLGDCLSDPAVTRQAAADATELHQLLSAKPGSSPTEWVREHLTP